MSSSAASFLGDQPPDGRQGRLLREPVIMRAASAFLDAQDQRVRLALAHVERLEVDRNAEASRRENLLCGGSISKHEDRMQRFAQLRRDMLEGRPCSMTSAQIDAAERRERDTFTSYMDALRTKTHFSEQCAKGRAAYERWVAEAREAVEERADELAAGQLMVARLAAIFKGGATGNWPISNITPDQLAASATELGQRGLDADASMAAPFLQILEDLKVAETCQTRAELIQKSGFSCGLEWDPPGRKNGRDGGGDGGAELQK